MYINCAYTECFFNHFPKHREIQAYVMEVMSHSVLFYVYVMEVSV